ncbi:MAG: hypothetical protein ACLRTJ_11500, partial [Christensenellales bacterium]
SLTAYNSGSVTPSDAGGCWRIIMVFPAAIPVCRTAHWGLPGKECTCYAGYSVVKVLGNGLYPLKRKTSENGVCRYAIFFDFSFVIFPFQP